jgi:adenylylsulfate kinase-like enzyme
MAPQHSQRDSVAKVLGNRLVWIYIHAPLDVCIARDPKGLYHRAQTGGVQDLLNFPFEVPRPPERENYIDTVAQGVEGCYSSILELAEAQLADFAI